MSQDATSAADDAVHRAHAVVQSLYLADLYDVAVTAASGEVLAHFRGRCSRLRGPTPSA